MQTEPVEPGRVDGSNDSPGPGFGAAPATLSLAATPRDNGKARGRSVRVQQAGLPLAWLVILLAFSMLRPHTFPTVANAADILGSQAVIAVLTLGVLLPMTTGDFDMSIASNLTLSSMLIAILNVNHHVPILLSILAALVLGAGIGLFNGVVTTWFGIDPFIVTLGSGTIANGVTLWISGSNTISGISGSLTRAVVGDHFLKIPLEFYYGLAVCIVIWLFLERTRSGRLFLVVGQGRAVARLSGIRVARVRIAALTASGVVGALAGILYAGTSGAADPTSGTQLLLPAFAGAFLGATAIKPGRFNAWGSFTAVYFLVTGISGLQMLGAQSYVQDLFYGGALVVAVGLSRLVRRREALDEENH
jgi:ribose transport system permease protein